MTRESRQVSPLDPISRTSSKSSLAQQLTASQGLSSPGSASNLSAVTRVPTSAAIEQSLGVGEPEIIEEFAPSSRQVWFPRSHIIRVDLSEPRDVLQSERTFLGFVRFSLSLYFTAIGLILGFQLKSDGSKGDSKKPGTHVSLFNKVVSFLLVFLAFATLAMAGVNYFNTVRRYSQRKISTSGPNNTVSVICVTAVVVTLAGLNVSLIIERYLQDS